LESTAGRYWKTEQTKITLHPVDVEQPRLGGKVQASVLGFDVRTFSIVRKNYYGVYGEDFLTYGEYKKDAFPADDDETLLKIFEQEDDTVVDKHSFRFENNKILYSRDVNGEAKDTEVEHPISESELSPTIAQSWTETFFYGLGNKNM